MSKSDQASFIVRLWWELDRSDDPVWRGQVVHAASRRSAYFQDAAGLIEFFERWMGNLSTHDDAEKGENHV